ncbi:MAG: 4Fe-4S binding protein, partial [Candidatus Omnitrophica bacterium]|nr:4Fe-4S binding protein [Candidatus Omnitrophota bacterium]
ADMDIILVSIFLILTVIFIFKRIVFLRVIFLSLGIIYFGFLKTLFISIFNVVNLLKLQFPSFLESMPWYILFGFSFLGALFLGRFYCGWLCPFGAVQDIISKIPSKKIRITYKLNSHLLKIKYILLILALVFVLKGKDFFLKLEPFTYFFKPNFSIFFIYSLIILAFSLFIPRFFCRYLCWVGAIFAILSKLSLLKYKLRCKKEGCNLCKERCPLGIIDELGNIKDSECIRCNLCQKCVADKKK